MVDAIRHELPNKRIILVDATRSENNAISVAKLREMDGLNLRRIADEEVLEKAQQHLAETEVDNAYEEPGVQEEVQLEQID